MNLFIKRTRREILLLFFIIFAFALDIRKTTEPKAVIEGRVMDAVELHINGQPIEFDLNSGYFSKDYILKEGKNLFVIRAVDALGNTSFDTIVYILDTTPPTLQILGDIPHRTKETKIRIEGFADDAETVWVNDIRAKLEKGYFTFDIDLYPDTNSIEIEAQDELGNETSIVLEVFLDRTPPHIKIYKPREMAVYTSEKVKVIGEVPDGGKVFVDGQQIFLDPNNRFIYEKQATLGINKVTIKAIDDVGNLAEKVVHFLVEKPDVLSSDSFVLIGDKIFTKESIYELQGRVNPDNIIVIDSEIVKPDTTGVFKKSLKLEEGENSFRVEVYGETY